MLEIRGLSGWYGGISALTDVSINVEAGKVVSLLGSNGAGKSTLLTTIMGVMPGRSTGSIKFNGAEILGRSTEDVVAMGIALSPEGRQLFSDLTVEENLHMGAYLRRDKAGIAADLKRVFTFFPRLLERRKQLASTLSGGEQQMVAIGRALMSSPRLLLLDEPTLGLSPLFVTEILKLVKKINEEGITVLLVEQNARQALRRSSWAYVMEKGRIQMSGAAETLARDPHVISAYLGDA
ncbi:ABC transporter ATP-binding protein [Ferrovibrio xuzhouensis]|uniref:ABC transporter ATP-binding protein n=1 Tax=Ferrovibrio xuzhouensis TaxID=1576914 RepID=A0ABV7VNT3_9PROT